MSSEDEVGAEGAGELPNAPKQDETPLKSNLVVVQTWGDFAVIGGPVRWSSNGKVNGRGKGEGT